MTWCFSCENRLLFNLWTFASSNRFSGAFSLHVLPYYLFLVLASSISCFSNSWHTHSPVIRFRFHLRTYFVSSLCTVHYSASHVFTFHFFSAHTNTDWIIIICICLFYQSKFLVFNETWFFTTFMMIIVLMMISVRCTGIAVFTLTKKAV